MSVNMKESWLAGHIACEDAAGGGSLIAFSHSSWNKLILMADCNPKRSKQQSLVTNGDSPVVKRKSLQTVE